MPEHRTKSNQQETCRHDEEGIASIHVLPKYRSSHGDGYPTAVNNLTQPAVSSSATIPQNYPSINILQFKHGQNSTSREYPFFSRTSAMWQITRRVDDDSARNQQNDARLPSVLAEPED
jgi:hypothetical protein